jgi:hypothetical protein
MTSQSSRLVTPPSPKLVRRRARALMRVNSRAFFICVRDQAALSNTTVTVFLARHLQPASLGRSRLGAALGSIWTDRKRVETPHIFPQFQIT